MRAGIRGRVHHGLAFLGGVDLELAARHAVSGWAPATRPCSLWLSLALALSRTQPKPSTAAAAWHAADASRFADCVDMK